MHGYIHASLHQTQECMCIFTECLATRGCYGIRQWFSSHTYKHYLWGYITWISLRRFDDDGTVCTSQSLPSLPSSFTRILLLSSHAQTLLFLGLCCCVCGSDSVPPAWPTTHWSMYHLCTGQDGGGRDLPRLYQPQPWFQAPSRWECPYHYDWSGYRYCSIQSFHSGKRFVNDLLAFVFNLHPRMFIW